MSSPLASLPRDLQKLCSLRESLSKLIYLNCTVTLWVGIQVSRKAALAAVSDLTPVSQELHHRLCWVQRQLGHSKTVYFHSLRDTFSRKAKWVETKVHPITAWTFPSSPVPLLTVSWPEPSPSSSSWPWFWIGCGRKVWRKQRRIIQREKEWGLLHTFCVRPGASLSWEDPLPPALSQTFPSFLERGHHQPLAQHEQSPKHTLCMQLPPLGRE